MDEVKFNWEDERERKFSIPYKALIFILLVLALYWIYKGSFFKKAKDLTQREMKNEFKFAVAICTDKKSILISMKVGKYVILSTNVIISLQKP